MSERKKLSKEQARAFLEALKAMGVKVPDIPSEALDAAEIFVGQRVVNQDGEEIKLSGCDCDVCTGKIPSTEHREEVSWSFELSFSEDPPLSDLRPCQASVEEAIGYYERAYKALPNDGVFQGAALELLGAVRCALQTAVRFYEAYNPRHYNMAMKLADGLINGCNAMATEAMSSVKVQ